MARSRYQESSYHYNCAQDRLPWKSYINIRNQNEKKTRIDNGTTRGLKSFWTSIVKEALFSSMTITGVLFVLNSVYLPIFTRWSICTLSNFHGCHAATYAAVPLIAFILSFFVALLLSTFSSNQQPPDEILEFPPNNYCNKEIHQNPQRQRQSQRHHIDNDNDENNSNSSYDLFNNNLKTGDGQRHNQKQENDDENHVNSRDAVVATFQHQRTPEFLNGQKSFFRPHSKISPEIEDKLFENPSSYVNANEKSFGFLDSVYAHLPTGAPPNSPKKKKSKLKCQRSATTRIHSESEKDNDKCEKLSSVSHRSIEKDNKVGPGPALLFKNDNPAGAGAGITTISRKSENGIDCVEPPRFYAEEPRADQKQHQKKNQGYSVAPLEPEEEGEDDEKGISDEEIDYSTLEEDVDADDYILCEQVKVEMANRNPASFKQKQAQVTDITITSLDGTRAKADRYPNHQHLHLISSSNHQNNQNENEKNHSTDHCYEHQDKENDDVPHIFSIPKPQFPIPTEKEMKIKQLNKSKTCIFKKEEDAGKMRIQEEGGNCADFDADTTTLALTNSTNSALTIRTRKANVVDDNDNVGVIDSVAGTGKVNGNDSQVFNPTKTLLAKSCLKQNLKSLTRLSKIPRPMSLSSNSNARINSYTPVPSDD